MVDSAGQCVRFNRKYYVFNKPFLNLLNFLREHAVTNLENDDVIFRGVLKMMMLDEVGKEGVKNHQKSGDVINVWPQNRYLI